MEEMKKLESNLYDEPESVTGHKSILKTRAHSIKNYFTKLSTHGGFYFSGIGCFVGGLGGLFYSVKDIIFSLYSDWPEIIASASKGSWQEVAYRFAYSLANSIAKSLSIPIYTTAAGGWMGYIGGSIITGKFWESLVSIFHSKKRQKLRR